MARQNLNDEIMMLVPVAAIQDALNVDDPNWRYPSPMLHMFRVLIDQVTGIEATEEQRRRLLALYQGQRRAALRSLVDAAAQLEALQITQVIKVAEMSPPPPVVVSMPPDDMVGGLPNGMTVRVGDDWEDRIIRVPRRTFPQDPFRVHCDALLMGVWGSVCCAYDAKHEGAHSWVQLAEKDHNQNSYSL